MLILLKLNILRRLLGSGTKQMYSVHLKMFAIVYNGLIQQNIIVFKRCPNTIENSVDYVGRGEEKRSNVSTF